MKKIHTLFIVCITFCIGFSQEKDQPSSSIGTGTGIDFIGAGQSFFQSFTAGVTGDITSVNLSLGAFTSGNITVSIWSGSNEGADLGASAIETVSFSVTGSAGAASPVTAFFLGAGIVSGQKYSIKVTSLGINLAYYGQGSNPYSGGRHTNKSGSPDPSRDVFFETFVIEEEIVPTVNLTDLCGTTVSYSTIANVDPVMGATQYRFEFLNLDSSFFARENRQYQNIKFSSVNFPKLVPGNSYLLDVIALGDDLDSLVVDACPITLYTPGVSKLQSGDCGRVITNANTTLTAEVAPDAEEYRFTFTATGYNTIERTQSSNVYDFNKYARYFAPGVVYNVDVRVLANGIISEPGQVCTIKTPGADKGVVVDCGTDYSSWNGIIQSEVQSGSQKYRFVFNDGVSPNVSYTSSRPYVKLRNVNGLQVGTQYNVRVVVMKGGYFGLPSDLPCSISTPNHVPARSGDAFVEGTEDIYMYPNPATGGYVHFSLPVHNLEVYDALGSLITSESYTENLDVSDLSAGMYILKSDEGFVKMMIK